MSILEKIKSDLKEAMKNKDEASLLTYRGLLSVIHNKEIELKKKELTDKEVISTLEIQAKQRRDSIIEFEKGGRDDLIEKEKKELKLIEEYLPQKLGEEEIKKIVDEVIKKTKATELKDMGRVMAELMKENKGQIDGATASRIVKEKLNK
ncbi:GatB/YqeY domain-containing protein [Patescibacteria group bacterium]|nr:GatB/YqeY domain-containing protein [Patescibacteria group bacterium]